METFRLCCMLFNSQNYPMITISHFDEVLKSSQANPDVAEKVFASIPKNQLEPTCKTWTLLISSHLINRNIPRALALIEDMKANGVDPNIYTFHQLLQAYLEANQYDMIEEIKETMKNYNLSFGIITYGIIIKSLTSKGNMRKAEHYFKELNDLGMTPSQQIYTSLVSGTPKTQMERALEIFESNQAPDRIAYNAILKLVLDQQKFDVADKLITKMSKVGIRPAMDTITIIITGYLKANRMKEAESLFVKVSESQKIGVHAFSALIAGFGKIRNFSKAREYLEKMFQTHGKNASAGYNALLAVYCRSKSIESVTDLLAEMKENQITKTDFSHNTLINFYCVQKSIACALTQLEVLERSSRPTIHSYTPIIDYYLRSNQLHDALDTLRDMIKGGIVPDRYIFKRFVSVRAQASIFAQYHRTIPLPVKHSRILCDFFARLIVKDHPVASQFLEHLTSENCPAPILAHISAFIGSHKINHDN